MADNTVLKGSLGFIGLADLFQILGGNSCTGVLQIKSPYLPDVGLIYFSKGSPVNSTAGSLKGNDAVFSLFGWMDGEFEFQEKKIQTEHLIKKTRMEVVLDALRMLDDGEIEKVGPPTFDPGEIGKKFGYGEDKHLPVIKGPFVDYAYVVSEESFNPGATIVKEGGFGKWLYVVYKGTAIVRKHTEKGILDVSRLGEGAFIGTFKALLFGDYNRNASVIAEDYVQLCSLSTDRLQKEYTSLSKYFQSILMELDRRLIKITNRAVELHEGKDYFNGIEKDTKVMIQKGDSKKDLYILKKGRAYIIGQTDQRRIPLISLERNDVFGYIPFIDFGHEPRAAHVVVTEDFEAEKINGEKFQEEYDKLSSTFKKMIYHISSCITMTTSVVYHMNA